MSALGSPSPLFLASAAADAAAAGPIKSVRFNKADSAYLDRTPSSAGNRKTWTWSGWVKRCGNSALETIFSAGGSNTGFRTNITVFFYQDDSSTHGGRLVVGEGNGAYLRTNARFRDPGAWGHLVIVTNTTLSTAADRIKIYWNGVRITDFDGDTLSSNVPQNSDIGYNTTDRHTIGNQSYNSGLSLYANLYLAEINFVDGQALAQTDFGEYDDNNVWRPKKYSGTYGTNGYHLFDFANESTVGHDSSGNGNDFTANNISTTAGAGNDVLFDVPVNGTQSDTGAGGEVSGNYCTINPLIVNQTNAITSNGNLHVKYPNTEDSWVGNIQGTNYVTFVGTMGLTSGKWYFEAVETVRETSTESMVVGVVDTPMGGVYHIGSVGNGIGYKRIEVKNGLGSSIVTTSSMPDFSVGDVVGVALDLDNGKIYFSVNGTYINSGNPAAGTGFLASGLSGTFFPAISRWSRRHSIEADLNFGQRAFNTSAPSGFKAICTANLPTSTVADGSTAFDAVLYTSTSGSGRTRTISGLNFSPDMVWSKRRSAAGRHVISDSVRGTNKELFPNRTDVERTSTDGLTAFTSDGYSSGPDSGAFGWSSDNATYVNYAWDAGTSNASNSSGSITSTVRANTTAGISIVSFTGTGSVATVGHGLGAAPEWIVVKNRDTSKNWIVYHAHIHSSPAEKSINLNESGELYDSAVTFNDTAPTSTVFSVGTGQSTNKSGDDHIAYCFAPVAGFSAFGSYTGNQSTNGTFVHTGFKPAFVMLKHTQTSGYDWAMNDSTRNTFNPASNALFPSSSDDEDSTRHVDLLSNGFKLRNSSPIYNQSGVVYIYMAFAENPFQANGGLAR